MARRVVRRAGMGQQRAPWVTDLDTEVTVPWANPAIPHQGRGGANRVGGGKLLTGA
jgi:hypothetical protein